MENKVNFRVHPAVIFQLGESLISDDIQALIELVKNSYDADATYAKVFIDTKGVWPVPESAFPGNKGRIIVEDDGTGMNFETIKSGWLVLSNRQKAEMKKEMRTTPGGRTPLGDKGLGRLGVQRLGDKFEIFTKTVDQKKGLHLSFSWLDFQTAPTLEQVDINCSEFDFPKEKGTKIVISDLYEPELWQGKEGVKRFEKEISQMISPYKAIRDFMVYVEVDGKKIDLVEISEKLRELAPVRYRIKFDGKTFSISGKASLDFIRPKSGMEDREMFIRFVEGDEGKEFFSFLASEKKARTINLSRASEKNWFVNFSQERVFETADKLQLDPSGKIANPGSFHGEIDFFVLDPNTLRQQAVFDKVSELREHIKSFSGIKVFRDGFRIRLDRDWLKLGGQWTSASSYYGLKPENTLGYIALTARENMQLEETTDREGFKDTPYYRNFYRLFEIFKAFTETSHEFIRRAWNEFKAKKHEYLAKIDARKSVEEISKTIKTDLEKAGKHKENLKSLQESVLANAKKASAISQRVKTIKDVTPDFKGEIEDTLRDLESTLKRVDSILPTTTEYLELLENHKAIGQVLQDRVEKFRQQMDEMYETMALGLTAEALSHEIFNIADQLAQKGKTTKNQLNKKGVEERSFLTFIESVHSAVLALRKQISFLAPSLRYVRERKDNVDLKPYFSEIFEFYKDRLERNNISLEVFWKTTEPFSIRINQGKFSQILDNLILNSEYWLREEIRCNRLKTGKISLEINKPFVRVYDNGRGIDPLVEPSLFEPFITTKTNGRGLGLFINRQLLASEDCNILLLPEKNHEGRTFKFQIDLRGIINE